MPRCRPRPMSMGRSRRYALDADVAKGSLTFHSNGTYSFNPDGAFEALGTGDNEQVTFTYHALDNARAQSAVMTVTITVNGVNDAPVALDDGHVTDEDTVLDAAVPAATDVDGAIASYALDTGVAKGVLAFNADGTFSFDPDGDFEDLATGEDEEIPFTYHAVDNDGGASPAQTIIITVAGLNDAPVASDGSEATDEDTVLNASVPAATDVDGTVASYALDTGVAKGTLAFNADGTYSFNPNGAFEELGTGENEQVAFTYHAVDDSGTSSATKTVTITVNGVSNAPTITSGASFAVKENTTAVGMVTATDSDDTPVYSIAGGADGALFSIDATTGALAFNASPDFENPADADGDNTYAVLVRASDGTTADTHAITVTVTDEDGVTIKGGKKKDIVDGGETVKGQAMPTMEEDIITGRGDNDKLSGLGGNDVLNGDDGKDKLFGGDGDDILIGGKKSDKLTGGGGSDSFVFGAKLKSEVENQGFDFGFDTMIPYSDLLEMLSPWVFGSNADGVGQNANVDRIMDFEAGIDTIVLAHGVFRGLKVGELSTDAFVVGNKARDGRDHIIYDARNGQLLYDLDGKGGQGCDALRQDRQGSRARRRRLPGDLIPGRVARPHSLLRSAITPVGIAHGHFRQDCKHHRPARQGARDAALDAFRRVAGQGRRLARAHHLPGRPAVLHRAEARRRRARPRADDRAVPGPVDRRPVALDERTVDAVAVRERARSGDADGERRRPEIRAARGTRHRPDRHPRHRHRRDRRRLPADLRQHAVLVPRHDQRHRELPAGVAAEIHLQRWRRRTAAT